MAIVLPGCKKINEALDDLGNRVTKLENVSIPTIEEQIISINSSISNLETTDIELKSYISTLQETAAKLHKSIHATNLRIDEVKKELKTDINNATANIQNELTIAKADVLAQLEAMKAEMSNELVTINSTIAVLQDKDGELEQEIARLRGYVDTEILANEDWANATFATLAQFNTLADDVAIIKVQIEKQNESIANLEVRLNTKIREDINVAVNGLRGELAQSIVDITVSYTDAISVAKSEITTAYTKALESTISTLEASIKSWINEQLANYYTIAQVDAMLAVQQNEIEAQLASQKSYLVGLITNLSESVNKSIADNKILIAALRADLTTAQGDIATNKVTIADNSESILGNASKIVENAAAISKNSNNIDANTELINENKVLVDANAALIAGNKAALETLGADVSTNATAIVKNTNNIAQNATLIAQNSAVIANNTNAIAQNASEISALKVIIETTKSEITKAYTKAISDAITTSEGKITTQIAKEVSTINGRIDNEIRAINSTIDGLNARTSVLECEVGTIKGTIANMQKDIDNIKEQISTLLSHIQSVSYVPQYSDGKATMKHTHDNAYSRMTLNFIISPKECAVALAEVYSDALSVKAIYTQTRTVADFIELPIVAFETEAERGIISITVSGENLSADFFAGTQEANAALFISDENNQVISEYVPIIHYAQPENEIWYSSLDNTIVEPYKKDAFGVNIISNTNQDGEGIIVFDGPVTSIGDYAFSGCHKLTSINIPHNVISIGVRVFQSCAITKITIPNSVTVIEDGAFANCKNLEEFNGKFASADKRCLIVDGVLNAFAMGCELSEYSIPNNVTSIGYHAFYACNIVSISIPNSVTKIDNAAFHHCSNLTNVTIPDSVTTIGDYAFSECSMTSITIPNSITEMGYSAFAGCNHLETFGGGLASADKRCLIIEGVLNAFAPAGLTEYTIPSNVTEIGKSAFSSCYNLTQVTISDNVVVIRDHAFEHCSNLQTIIIPEGVTELGDDTFCYCESLKSITIPSSTTKLGSRVFCYCSNLDSVYCKAITPPLCNYTGLFDYNSSNRKIYVPYESLNLYREAQIWSDYIGDIIGYHF